jgi:hypothetical protein
MVGVLLGNEESVGGSGLGVRQFDTSVEQVHDEAVRRHAGERLLRKRWVAQSAGHAERLLIEQVGSRGLLDAGRLQMAVAGELEPELDASRRGSVSRASRPVG